MMLRHKVGTKLLFYHHLPIKISLIIMTRKRWYCELNLSIRIIGHTVIITLMVVVVDTTHTCHVVVKTSSQSFLSEGYSSYVPIGIIHRVFWQETIGVATGDVVVGCHKGLQLSNLVG